MTTLALPTSATSDTPQSHRFTRDEYYKMAEAGLFQGHRVELIDGEILDMPPQNDPHAVAILLVQRALLKALPHLLMRCQLPLTFGKKSEPEPDFAFTEGEPRDYLGTGKHPAHALLVIEISESTLSLDRRKKASLYARANISDYWIINLRDHCLEVYRDPVPDLAIPLGHRYKTVITLKPPEIISPLANPAAQIPVADLIP